MSDLLLPNDHGWHHVPTSTIRYILRDGKRCRVVTENGEYYFLGSLRKIQAKLPADKFFRIHKSYIVALGVIRLIGKKDLAIGDQVLPLSRRKRLDLFGRFDK